MKKLLLLLLTISLYAGPPMLTNDPFLPEKDFEINTAVQTTITDKENIYLPTLDMNYAASKNLELTLYTTYEIESMHKESKDGFSLTEFAFKYHFFSQEGLSAAIVGGYRVAPSRSVFDEKDEYEVQVPLNYKIKEDLNLVLTTTYVHPVQNEEKPHFELGSYLQYDYKRHNFFIECVAEENQNEKKINYLSNFGHIYEINSMFSTLFSAGTTLNAKENKDEIILYTGLQIRLKM